MASGNEETSALSTEVQGISEVKDYTKMKDWVIQSMISGVKDVVGMLSSINFSSDWTAERDQLSQSLRALEAMIDCAKLDDTTLSWFTTKVNDILDAAENMNMSALEIELNVKFIEEKSPQIVALLERARSLREQKQKVLEMEAKAARMRAAFEARKLELKNEESMINAKLKEKRLELERLDKELEEAWFRMQQLEDHKKQLRSLLAGLRSFAASLR